MEPQSTFEVFEWKPKYSTEDVHYLDIKSKSPPTLRLLILSNLCNKLSHLYRMKNYIREHPCFIDYAICLGNLTNLSRGDKKMPEIQAKGEGEISSMLDYIENLGCKVLYIPGDTDPDSLYEYTEEKRPKLTANSHNIHKTCYKLAEGLVVAGLGGYISEAAEYLNDCGNYASSGYFANSLRSVLQNTAMMHDKSQIILASYISPITNGEKAANAQEEYMPVISDLKAQVVSILHGNSAVGKAMVDCEGIISINPGALKTGNMLIMDLIRVKGKWEVTSTEFVNLI
eukprot:TRINITY_DN496_c0_g1_i1.p1 TRINITY_DN496_c0_g1~~TRINITY_DN496_c0_g1_i1.p1  ORF type:complete len:314 (+),score=22.48 TRINITY_DN496_c0_g1_i1:86-943(+)